jgi:hypothetical protein
MAIRLTKVMLLKNPSNLKVRQMVCARCDQFETAFKPALICLGVKAGIAINHSRFLPEPLFADAGEFFYSVPSACFYSFHADAFFRSWLRYVPTDVFVCQYNWIYRLEAWSSLLGFKIMLFVFSRSQRIPRLAFRLNSNY